MTGRTILVTGGNRGIGAAIVQEFLASGDKVVSLSRTGDPIPGVLSLAADVASTSDVEQAVTRAEEEYGPVDVLVANSGITRDTLMARMSDADFGDVLDVNLTGAFRCARRVVMGMVKKRGGRMIFVSSVAALSGSKGQTNYAAAKAGMIGLARAIAVEYGARGITANVVAPGFIETAMTAALPAARQTEIKASIPAARFATTGEVAGVVHFLASPAAAYINGTVIAVDGGLGMGH